MDNDLVRNLVQIVERKDQVTVAHTWRVALYSQAMAEAAGLSSVEVIRLMQGAVLHDVGKIDIPTSILAKPGPLTDAEMRVIQSHTVLGWERLTRMGVTDPLILGVVRWHHERMDGSGYPDGLTGDKIPMAARVFAVIDSFDAMTSIRPYRRETGRGAAGSAIEDLRSHAGTWYCTDCVRRFADLYESGSLDWILDYFNDDRSLEMLGRAFG